MPRPSPGGSPSCPTELRKKQSRTRTCWPSPRRPSREEAQIARAHLARQKDLYLKANVEDSLAEKKALESLCHLLFLTNEFLYIG